MKHLKKGFTLVELIVVLMLMGIITTAIAMIMNPANQMYVNITNKSGEEDAAITLGTYLNGRLRYATVVQVVCTKNPEDDPYKVPSADIDSNRGFTDFIVLSNQTRESSKKGARGRVRCGDFENINDQSKWASPAGTINTDEYDFQFSISGTTATGKESMTVVMDGHPMKTNDARDGFEPDMDKPYNYAETFQFLNIQNKSKINVDQEPWIKIEDFFVDNDDPSNSDNTIWIFFTNPTENASAPAAPPVTLPPAEAPTDSTEVPPPSSTPDSAGSDPTESDPTESESTESTPTESVEETPVPAPEVITLKTVYIHFLMPIDTTAYQSYRTEPTGDAEYVNATNTINFYDNTLSPGTEVSTAQITFSGLKNPDGTIIEPNAGFNVYFKNSAGNDAWLFGENYGSVSDGQHIYVYNEEHTSNPNELHLPSEPQPAESFSANGVSTPAPDPETDKGIVSAQDNGDGSSTLSIGNKYNQATVTLTKQADGSWTISFIGGNKYALNDIFPDVWAYDSCTLTQDHINGLRKKYGIVLE